MKYYLVLFLIVGTVFKVQAQDAQITTAAVSFTFVKKDVTGSISGFKSTSKIDWNDLENSVIEGQVETETLKTGNFIRDWSLKGSKYFDAEAFPLITFKSNRLVLEDSDLMVYGTLTLKGISKPIEIRFTRTENSLKGSTTLFTPDFDITILKNNRENNKVIVILNLIVE